MAQAITQSQSNTPPNAPPTYVLNSEVHERLIQDMEHICYTAGIERRYVEHSMKGIVNSDEEEWFKNFPVEKKNYSGLLFHGSKNIQERMAALCGGFIRNFIDARVVTLGRVVPLKAGVDPSVDPYEPTVLMIPNFHVKTHGGKPLTAWQIQILYDALASRMASGKQTVVFAESLEAVGNDYGMLFRELLENHYKRIEG